jgi:carbonic anhydrase
LGHEKCGAVTAASGDDKPGGNLGKLLNEIHIGDRRSANKDQALADSVESNVRFQTKVLTERSEVIREHVKEQKVQIASGVYDLATGKVRWLETK